MLSFPAYTLRSRHSKNSQEERVKKEQPIFRYCLSKNNLLSILAFPFSRNQNENYLLKTRDQKQPGFSKFKYTEKHRRRVHTSCLMVGPNQTL